MARALALAGLLILRADAGKHYHRLIARAELSALIVCTGVAFDQLDVHRERGGGSKRLALLAPASRKPKYRVGVAA